MANWFVGPGGSDTNTGSPYSSRFATIAKAMSSLSAGDTVYLGPGVYRETVTPTVSGASAAPVTVIGDVTGYATDGIGGLVRLSGSDNDQTASRAECVVGNTGVNYYTIVGILLDTASSYLAELAACTNWIFDSCAFQGGTRGLEVNPGAENVNHILRRCIFDYLLSGGICIEIQNASGIMNCGMLIENSILQHASTLLTSYQVGGATIKNSILANNGDGAGVTANGTMPGGFTPVSVINSLLVNLRYNALNAGTAGYITEDYNLFWGNYADRGNTAAGAHSVNYPPLWLPQRLFAGTKLPPVGPYALSQYSAAIAQADSSGLSDDLYGLPRPATSGKRSWGPIQWQGGDRSTTQYHSASASIRLADSGVHQIWLPVTSTSTTVSVWVYREAGYTGTAPQMVIKQPGQADVTVTDTGASGQWNQLTTTLTPSSTTSWVVVELVSNNTATSGSYNTYFDDLAVS